MSSGTGNGHLVTRRPAETATLTAGVAASLIAKIFGIEDPDILTYLPAVVGAIPSLVTAAADYIARHWGRTPPAP